MLNILKSKKGMTLVEIIVSMTIFSIMVVAFLNLFFGSFLISLRAEARTNTVGEVAGAIENKISTLTPSGITTSVSIQYHGGYTNTANGTKISDSVTNSDDQTVTFTYFVPEEH